MSSTNLLIQIKFRKNLPIIGGGDAIILAKLWRTLALVKKKLQNLTHEY